MKINEIDELNILGYSGSILAIYFDILISNGFKGKINIIKNDDRTDMEQFDSGMNYKVFNIKDFCPKENRKYFLCSNKPSTKILLLEVFSEKIPQLELKLLPLIHATSYISPSAIIEKGIVLEAMACIAPYAELGKGVFISRTSTVGHHTKIGNWSTISPGVTIAGKIKIGESVTIGPGSTIFSRTSIGNNTIIGGGSVVTKDIPEGVIAYGNPCKVIREIK